VIGIFGQGEPWQAFLGKELLRGLKSSGVIECEHTDMKMYFWRALTFAGQAIGRGKS